MDDIREHHASEWLNVSAELGAAGAAHARNRRARGRSQHHGRARQRNQPCWNDELHPFAGDTSVFLFPGVRIRSVDALLTNFHLPESTLLMLVSAFAVRDRILGLSTRGRARYRFFSYGDAMPRRIPQPTSRRMPTAVHRAAKTQKLDAAVAGPTA